jgi:uncharacterized protein YbjQ (UPF0145 family)
MLQFGPALALLMGAYLIGSLIESAHFRALRRREKASRSFAAITFPKLPENWTVLEAELVMANVVVSIDYFKRFVAGLRGLIGGRIRAYETLLDRGRREAIMRVKEEAQRRGFSAVINIRLETARLASSSRRGEGTAGVEVLAFGTAIKLAR